jgi:hypothetical protein
MRIAAERLVSSATVFGYLLAAVIIGAVIASGNLIVQAIAGGALLSVVLMGAPSVALWIVLLGTLLVSGPLVFHFQGLSRLPWLFSVLGFFLLFAAFIYEGLGKTHRFGKLPHFVLVGVVFVIYVIASALWSKGTANEAMAGVKRVLQFWGVMMALAMIPFSRSTVQRMILVVIALSVMQFPLAIYQRLFLVSALPANSLDTVTGTLELSRWGQGSSGVLGFWQIAMLAALAAMYRERLVSGLWMIVLCGAVCIPIVLGDVNIVFIWLPMALAAVFYDQIRERPLRFALWTTLFVGAMVAFGMFYLIFQQLGPVPHWSLEERLRDLYEYNLGSRGYGAASDLNRTTVFTYWWSQHGAVDPVTTFFGHGVGSAFVASSDLTDLVLKHGMRALDLVAASGMLWELGLVGLGLFLWMLVLAGLSAMRLCRIADPGRDRALARALLAAIVLVAGTLPYNSTVLQVPSQQVLAFFSLGVLAWLERRYATRSMPHPVASSAVPTSGGAPRTTAA